jgi:hypothetical protein
MIWGVWVTRKSTMIRIDDDDDDDDDDDGEEGRR